MVLILALAALLAVATPVHASEFLIEERTETYAASVAFDPAVAAQPALDEALRADATAALDEFKALAESAPPMEGRTYHFALEDRVAFASDRYLGVVRRVASDTGGAHGMLGVEALTWDMVAQTVVGLDALVSDPEGLEAVGAALRESIAREVHDGAPGAMWRADIAEATRPDAIRHGSFVIAADAEGRPSGLDFHFSPYDVGPWAAGAPVIHVPASAFADALTPEGAALFSR